MCSYARSSYLSYRLAHVSFCAYVLVHFEPKILILEEFQRCLTVCVGLTLSLYMYVFMYVSPSFFFFSKKIFSQILKMILEIGIEKVSA